MRSFIAVEISCEIKDALGEIIAKFRGCGADVKWVRPANLHVTLKFLGDIDENDIVKISEIVRECSLDIKPFDLAIEGIGAFPDLEKPRVIFVNMCDEIENLSILFDRFNDKLSHIGIKKEDRKFEAHLTIGRVKSLKGIEPLLEMIEAEKTRCFGEEYVESVVFMMSELLPKGPRYSKLDTIKLLKNI